MSADTAISWATKTWNPTVGCEHVSAGCDHCYAKTLHDMRHKAYLGGKLQNIPQYAEPFETVQMMAGRLTDPLSWRAPERVFVNSVSDVFHKDVPLQFIDAIMGIIALALRHTFMILTKRPARMRVYSRLMLALTPAEREARIGTSQWPLPNLIFGVSAENQATADQRIPMLLEAPAALRFVSCEPLLGPIEFSRLHQRCPEHDFQGGRCREWHAGVRSIDWVIVGGESGAGARPMHPEWARSLRDQCIEAGIAFHFKQWGEFAPEGPSTALWVVPSSPLPLMWSSEAKEPDPDSVPPYTAMYRVGVRRAGRELDGRTWDEFPATPAAA